MNAINPFKLFTPSELFMAAIIVIAVLLFAFHFARDRKDD